MSDIFREVDEDIRREQIKKVWDRIGPYVIGAAILIVVLTAGYRGWEYFRERQAQASGDRFLAAIQLSDQGNYAESIAALEALAADGSGGYPTLAQFRIATEKARSGDTTGAVAAFDAIVQSNAPEQIRMLASLRSAALVVDTASFEEMEASIGNLTSTGNPWRHTARELLGLSAWNTGNYTAAREYFDAIASDQETPQDMRQRVELMTTLIGEKAAGAPAAEPTPAEAPAPGEPATPVEPPAATDVVPQD